MEKDEVSFEDSLKKLNQRTGIEGVQMHYNGGNHKMFLKHLKHSVKCSLHYHLAVPVHKF